MATNITAFDKATVIRLDGEVVQALTAFATEHGLTVRDGGGTYYESTYALKLHFEVIGSNPDAERFKRHARAFGLKPDDLGKTVKWDGHVAGTARRNRPWCWRPRASMGLARV
jgi:hypothetical protein